MMNGRFCHGTNSQMVIGGDVMARYLLGTGIRQSSLVSPILFMICMSGLMRWIEERVSREEGLTVGDNVRWVATGRNINQLLKNSMPAPQ